MLHIRYGRLDQKLEVIKTQIGNWFAFNKIILPTPIAGTVPNIIIGMVASKQTIAVTDYQHSLADFGHLATSGHAGYETGNEEKDLMSSNRPVHNFSLDYQLQPLD